MPKANLIKEGETLFDVHRHQMGNTTMTELGWWPVKILKVYPGPPDRPWDVSADVSWNHNKAQRYYRHALERLCRKLPKKLDPDGRITARYTRIESNSQREGESK